jgi:xylulokinase
VAGETTSEVARATGLPAGIPVVYGGGDSHCALLGLGGIHAGDSVLLLGTNSTLRTVFQTFVAHPAVKLWVQRHVVPGRYTVSASSMAGASVLKWFIQTFLHERTPASGTFQEWEQAAAAVPLGSAGLVFLPYIHGERCPFYDPSASGAFVGMRHGHKTEHFVRSIIEGVAVNIANCLDLIQVCAQAQGVHIQSLRLGGGGSRGTLWHQAISDCLNLPLEVMNTEEAGTLGAALLAGIGAGIYRDAEAAVSSSIRRRYSVEPDPEKHGFYLELKDRFNALQRKLAFVET